MTHNEQIERFIQWAQSPLARESLLEVIARLPGGNTRSTAKQRLDECFDAIHDRGIDASADQVRVLALYARLIPVPPTDMPQVSDETLGMLRRSSNLVETARS